MKLMVLAGLALAAAVVAAGCSKPLTTPAPTGTPSSAAATPGPSATPTARTALDGTIGTAGSDGLTVRYRDPEGGLKSVRVEDFRR